MAFIKATTSSCLACLLACSSVPSRPAVTDSILEKRTSSKQLPKPAEKPPVPTARDLELESINDVKKVFLLGLRRDRAQQWKAAADAYEKVIVLDKDFLRARINLGLVLIQLKNFKRANEECSFVLQANELISMAHYCIAEAFSAEGRLSEAIPSYVRALATREKAPIVRLAFAQALLKKGNIANASAQLTKTASEAIDRPDILLHVAQEFLTANKPQEAVKTYHDLLVVHPNHFLARLKFGRLLMKTSLSAQAGAHFEKANKLQVTNIKPVLALLNWSFQEGKQAQASAYLDLAKSCVIERSDTHLKLAHYYWHFGKDLEASNHIKLGLSKPATVSVTRSLERMRSQIKAGQRPKKVNPFYSSKKRIPVAAPLKSRTPVN